MVKRIDIFLLIKSIDIILIFSKRLPLPQIYTNDRKGFYPVSIYKNNPKRQLYVERAQQHRPCKILG